MSKKRAIMRNGHLQPNFHIKIMNFCLIAGVNTKNVVLNISQREIQVIDYYRNEISQAIHNYAKIKYEYEEEEMRA